MLDYADERARVGRVGPEWRREGVVDDVDVGAVRRDRRCCVEAAVAGAFDRARRQPGAAAVGRFGEVDVRLSERPAHVTHVRSGWSRPLRLALRLRYRRSVRARGRCGRLRRRRSPVGLGRIERAGLGDWACHGKRSRPRGAAIVRAGHQLEGLMTGRRDGAHAEHVARCLGCRCGSCIHRPGCVGCCSRPPRLVLCPACRRRHGRQPPAAARALRALACTPEGGPAHVHRAEEGARGGVVRPDLLFVGERRGGLPANATGAHPAAAHGVIAVAAARMSSVRETAIASKPSERLGRRAWRRGLPSGLRSRAASRSPAEPVRTGPGPDSDRGIAVGDEPGLVVPGQRADRTRPSGCTSGSPAPTTPRHPRAGQTGVGRLRPGRAVVEGEIDPGRTHPGRERARVVGPALHASMSTSSFAPATRMRDRARPAPAQARSACFA